MEMQDFVPNYQMYISVKIKKTAFNLNISIAEYVPPPTYTTTTEYSTPSTEKYPEPTTTKQEYKY